MDSDSDFYGDEETVSALERRVSDFDVLAWWDRRGTITKHLLQHHQTTPTPTNTTTTEPLHDPYPDTPGMRSLSEPVDSFLARLPPATTDWQPGLDWLWITNPYHQHDPPTDLPQFLRGGAERLALFADLQTMTATATTSSSSSAPPGGKKPTPFQLQRDLSLARRETISDLIALAGACGVVSGKWMLFPAPGNVNAVWAKVAHATARGELGVCAKVETRVRADKERLVCVYTRDFRDRGDVARVLERMREMELVGVPGGRQVYYKSDAWTHLGIYGENRWGIKASTYSSNEIFSYIKSLASQR